MSATIRYNDLPNTRCKLAAIAEMFLDHDASCGMKLDSDVASGVFAILSDICADLEDIERESARQLSKSATT